MLKSMQEVLEYGFDVLNEVYFNGELPPIVITIMSSPRSRGHFTLTRDWRVDNETFHEINISAEHLDRPIENILATLCHEMVHYYNWINHIQDVSSGGRYHNLKFKTAAEQRGLIISQARFIGWSLTAPSEEFIDVIKSHGIEKPLDINRDGDKDWYKGLTGGDGNIVIGVDGTAGGLVLPKKPKCSTRKYQCPCCNNSFRATKDINVLCLDCMVEFQKVEK